MSSFDTQSKDVLFFHFQLEFFFENFFYKNQEEFDELLGYTT